MIRVMFQRSYSSLSLCVRPLQLIHTCHRRGAHAMGGMAAQIPVKNNPKLAAAALESVRKDKVSQSSELWGSDNVFVSGREGGGGGIR